MTLMTLTTSITLITSMALMTLTYDYFTFPGKVVIQCEHINKADFTAASGFKAMVEDFEGRKQPVKIKHAKADFCLAKSYLTFPYLVRKDPILLLASGSNTNLNWLYFEPPGLRCSG